MDNLLLFFVILTIIIFILFISLLGYLAHTNRKGQDSTHIEPFAKLVGVLGVISLIITLYTRVKE